MKSLPPGMQAHLDSGTTTLAWCWRLTRRDGVRFGFTDHDRALTFDGTIFEANAGFTASEIKDSVGLSVDNLDVESALTSNALTEADLAAGRYDDAAVEIFRVNWQDTTQRLLMRKGSVGEVRRAGNAFSAEIRGLAHYLQQPRGRLYQYTCDATLGDARCMVPLNAAANRATATCAALSNEPAIITLIGFNTFAPEWFTRGICRATSGGNTGHAIEIKRHTVDGANATTNIELWANFPHTPSIGDTFEITAGCDKHYATCRDKFANAVNFRGFPHMPGNDFVVTVARPGTGTANGQSRLF